jgi:hypothetical protein
MALAAFIVVISGTAEAMTASPSPVTSGSTISSSQMNSNLSNLATAINTNRVIYSWNGGCSTACPTVATGSTAPVTINRISLTATGPGIVIVDFNGSMECSLSPSTPYEQVYAQIVNSPTAYGYGYQDGGTMTRMTATWLTSAQYFIFPMHTQRVFNVAGAGTYTYYYNANQWTSSASMAACHFFGGNMSAVFIPTP